MKRLDYITVLAYAILIVVFIFAGCSEKNEPWGNEQENIAGHWEMTDLTVTPSVNGITSLYDLYMLLSDCTHNFRFNFEEAGSVNNVIPVINCSGTTTEVEEITGLKAGYKWNVTENKIRITRLDGTYAWAYLTVSGNQMIWTWQEDGYTFNRIFSRVN